MDILMKADMKRNIITEAVMKARPVEEISGAVEVTGRESFPFNYMRDEDMVAAQCRLKEKMEKTFNRWNRLRNGENF